MRGTEESSLSSVDALVVRLAAAGLLVIGRWRYREPADNGRASPAGRDAGAGQSSPG